MDVNLFLCRTLLLFLLVVILRSHVTIVILNKALILKSTFKHAQSYFHTAVLSTFSLCSICRDLTSVS